MNYESNSFVNASNSIKYVMLLKYFMEWVSWLAWDEGSTGKEVRKDHGMSCGKQFSLGGGLFMARAIWSFSIV